MNGPSIRLVFATGICVGFVLGAAVVAVLVGGRVGFNQHQVSIFDHQHGSPSNYTLRCTCGWSTNYATTREFNAEFHAEDHLDSHRELTIAEVFDRFLR